MPSVSHIPSAKIVHYAKAAYFVRECILNLDRCIKFKDTLNSITISTVLTLLAKVVCQSYFFNINL